MPLYLPAASTANQFTASYGYRPADMGMLAWNWDPGIGQQGLSTATPGILNGGRLYTPVAITVTNLWVNVFTAGATLTSGQNLAGLYNAAGNLLAATADQSTNWTTTGTKVMALTSAQAVPAGWFDVALFTNGTTRPAFLRSGTSASGINQNLAGSAIRAYTTSAAAATTAMPTALGTKTALNAFYWFGVS